MKPIDYDFEKQKLDLQPYKTFFVADMHELINPQPTARRLYDAMKQRSLSDTELKAIYHNSEDPLVTAVKKALTLSLWNQYRMVQNGTGIEDGLLFSLGDMVANRVNLGEGTERSIVGKLAKKARELGVSQHVYLMEHVEQHREELQEFAHRNNLWTKLRFDTLDELLKGKDEFTFAHLNGNADVFSSLIGETVLPDEMSPVQIYEHSTAIKRYHKSEPGFLLDLYFYASDPDLSSDGKTIAYILIPQVLDFTKKDNMVGYEFKHLFGGGYQWSLDNCFTSKFSYLMHDREDGRAKITDFRLLIHEALDPKVCEKDQNVEGIDVYNEFMSKFPIGMVVHGHTHNPNLVKYDYDGSKVTQVSPNKLVDWDEISNEEG